MTRYTQKADGRWYNKDTGEREEPPSKWKEGDPFPRFSTDTWAGHKSQITGGVVQGARALREERAIAADRGLVPFERIDGRPAGLINEEFASKGGRKTSEVAKEWAANKRKSQAVKTDAKGALLVE